VSAIFQSLTIVIWLFYWQFIGL